MIWKIDLTESEFKQCEEFAINSSKSQRPSRSGGTIIRELNQIEKDTLRGKVAEVVAKKFFEQTPFNFTGIKLDFKIYPRGAWDKFDFSLNNKTFSVKSAKSFSRWLLIESKDIARGDLYNYYVFITIAEDFKSGYVRGFATQDEILNDKNTLKLKKEEHIPGTKTDLDADNHARHSSNLHNTEAEWTNLSKILK